MKRFLAARQSGLIALWLAIALGGWLLSGQWRDPSSVQAQAVVTDSPQTTDKAMQVRVRDFQAKPISREIIVSARTEPVRAVTVRAEIDARVIAVNAEKGAPIEKGEIILQLDPRDRQAQLAEAEALVKQRKLQHQAAQRLFKKNLQAESQVAEALANLESARAQYKRIEVEIANTTIRAPFSGILDQRPVEIGDYLSSGDPVARVLEQDPLLVVGDVAQHEVANIRSGGRGVVRLVTGQLLEGEIRYVAAEADVATRTFRVELAVANPDGTMVSGLTAQLRIPTPEINAHYLSNALLSLNEAGQIGVKTVATDNRVAFQPTTIVSSGPDGVWVTGLPERVRIITVGQGFVQPGQTVQPVEESVIADRFSESAGGNT